MRQKKFSMIEMMVVTAIIMILISLLFSSLKTVVSASHQTHCKVNVKQISNAQHIYADEYDNYFVPMVTRHNGWKNWSQILDIVEILDPHDESLFCPSHLVNLGYGMNQTTHGGSWRSGIDRPINRDLLTSPSQKIQGGDSTTWLTYESRANPEQSRGWLLNEEDAWRSLAYRHRETANIFYFDGHVKNLNLYEFNEAKAKSQFRYNSDAIKALP